MANVWPATQSQLYGELNRLADTGLIEVSAIGPRGRKEYRATPTGRAELLRWIANPQDDLPERSAKLLRVFLLGELPRAQAGAHLRALADHSDSEIDRLSQLERSISWGDTDSEFFAHAALEYGLRVNAMQAEWARRLVDRLDRRHP